MGKLTAMITAVGGYVPEYILTNEELVTTLDTTPEWIESKLGVKERRIMKEPGKGTSAICIPVAQEICRKRNISPEEIDMLIVATSTPDMPTPCTSNLVAGAIGAKNAWAFDISLACSGFLAALDTGARYIESGRYKKIMIIGADKMSSIIDYTERLTSAVFADGGGGVLLEPDENGYGLLDSIFKTDGSGAGFVAMKAGGSARPASLETITNKEHFLYMDPKAVFRYAVSSLEEILNQIMQRNNIRVEDIKWLVPHQANKIIVETALQIVGLPREKAMINIQRYGNTSAGTIPLCLWDYEKLLRKDDLLLFVSFGAGFTWGAASLKWGYDAGI